MNNSAAITEDFVRELDQTLQEYKQGKQSIDQKVTENEQWWRLRHWEEIDKSKETIKDEAKRRPTSAWLFNSIINKHADIMDNFPRPNILPRKPGDEQYAQELSDIIPITLERCNYEDVYSEAGYDILIQGGRCTGVFWDQTLDGGLGGNVIKNIDVHNLFWKPGITRLSDSDKVFNVTLMDVDLLKAIYPQYADRITPIDSGKVAKYVHDDNIDTSNMAEVVDCYYRITQMVSGIQDENGESLYNTPKTVLHLVKYCGDCLLFASENDPQYADGYYKHGMYPFVLKPLFRVKDSAWGFGFVDVMQSPQMFIDVVDDCIMKNAILTSRKRYFVSAGTDIDLDKFADFSELIVPVAGTLGEDRLQPITVDALPGQVMSYQEKKIDELKETSGNRDFSQGSTAAGVTAASAIASLQEAGSKLARDINKILYRAHQEEVHLMVENLRQFAEAPQTYRIDDGQGGFEFMEFNNDNIKDSVFDIKISAEKQSPFSRAAQNETAKEMYSMGMFAPESALASLACIDMMEFEGKENVKQSMAENSQILQQYQQMQATILQLDAVIPGIAMQAGLIDPMQVQMQAQANQEQGNLGKNGQTANERAARTQSDTTLTAKARQKAAKQASVG